jgi:hypothetical protein
VQGTVPMGHNWGSRVEADVSPAVEVLAARVGRTGAALRGCVDAFAATARRNTNGPPDALTSRWGTLVRHGRLRNQPAGESVFSRSVILQFAMEEISLILRSRQGCRRWPTVTS